MHRNNKIVLYKQHKEPEIVVMESTGD
jgi:hypothetical protein